MELFGWVFSLFVVGVASFWIGDKYGKSFVANVVKIEMEAEGALDSVGSVYQKVSAAIKKHL